MTQQKKSQVKITRSNSDNVPTFYVNNVELRVSQWDFRFLMGEIESIDTDKKTLHVKDAVQIYMSPQHAKNFANLIARQIARYEKMVGPIVLVEEPGEEDGPE